MVKGMVAIFTYGFDEAEQNFKKEKCLLETLTNYDTLVAAALEQEYISEKDVNSLKTWRANPAMWSEGLLN
jgi:orotate phosphoribosyltransferase